MERWGSASSGVGPEGCSGDDRPSPGVERPAEDAGESGEFRGLGAEVRLAKEQLTELVLGLVELGLAAAKAVGLFAVAGLQLERCEPVERRDPAGIGGDQRRKEAPLGGAIVATRPAARPGSPAARTGRAASAGSFVEACQTPASSPMARARSSLAPDGGVIRPSGFAALEPASGFIEPRASLSRRSQSRARRGRPQGPPAPERGATTRQAGVRCRAARAHGAGRRGRSRPENSREGGGGRRRSDPRSDRGETAARRTRTMSDGRFADGQGLFQAILGRPISSVVQQ